MRRVIVEGKPGLSQHATTVDPARTMRRPPRTAEHLTALLQGTTWTLYDRPVFDPRTQTRRAHASLAVNTRLGADHVVVTQTIQHGNKPPQAAAVTPSTNTRRS
ncbi:unnamed protein product [Danaus chrysippus]|uniref:(African queen) hypothetical protein n=1 Tax=Danaus chrysippus TaxID=151541 RepID=A0A8J2R4Z6_9NEOP|nr:unnamed protein product [Danaus chrysippus]